MDVRENITGLQHIGLPVKDFDESLKFYTDLGFELVYRTENDGVPVGFLRKGNVTLETYYTPDPAMKAGAINHIALDVKDINAMYDVAVERGYNIMEPGIVKLPFWSNGVAYFNVIGPNGETVEFSQML